MLTEAGSLGEFHFVSRLRSRGNPQQEFFSSFLVSFMSIYWGSASLCTHKTAETIWNHEVIRVRMVSSMYIYIIYVYILCIYLPGPCKSIEFYSLRVHCWWLPGHRFLLLFLEDSTIHRHHSKVFKTVYTRRIHVWYIYLHYSLIFGLNVGKYTSPMDPMGMKKNSGLDIWRFVFTCSFRWQLFESEMQTWQPAFRSTCFEACGFVV